MVVEITQDVREKVMKMFFERLEEKRKKKGHFSFNSRSEVSGKMLEEFQEFVDATHDKKDGPIIEEELDLMITAFWGVCSKVQGAW